jgi:hypothetical protein
MSMLGNNVRVGGVRGIGGGMPMSGGVAPPTPPPSYESNVEREKRKA